MPLFDVGGGDKMRVVCKERRIYTMMKRLRIFAFVCAFVITAIVYWTNWIDRDTVTKIAMLTCSLVLLGGLINMFRAQTLFLKAEGLCLVLSMVFWIIIFSSPSPSGLRMFAWGGMTACGAMMIIFLWGKYRRRGQLQPED
jgi:hypothetical protein